MNEATSARLRKLVGCAAGAVGSFSSRRSASTPKPRSSPIRELFEGKQQNIPLVDASAFREASKKCVGIRTPLPF